MGLGPVAFILIIMAVIVVLGMFLETIAIILITAYYSNGKEIHGKH